jgi:hypothetical protein
VGAGDTALAGGGVVRSVLLVLAFAISVSGIVFSLLFALPALGAASGVVSGGLLGLDVAREAVRRDRAVRRLVVAAYEAGAAQKSLAALTEVLGTPDVVQARTAHLRREAAVLAQRYANGDASDY